MEILIFLAGLVLGGFLGFCIFCVLFATNTFKAKRNNRENK